jgi:hypothetical protein
MKSKWVLLLVLHACAAMAYAAESDSKFSESVAHAGQAGHAHGDHSAMEGMSGDRMKMRSPAWTSYPLLKTKMSGENREQRSVTLMPQNIVANSIEAFSNNLKDDQGRRQLPLEMAGAKLDKPANGGFHWLSAREEQTDKVLVASTVYSFGERTAKDPTAMFLQPKHELEIIPQPYPREHSRYRADENWKFIVHFNGNPLPDQKVVFETQNGTRSEWVSDAQGVITVRLPDDFKMEESAASGERKRGMQAMQGAEFILVTAHAEGGKSYLTAFNSIYGKNAFDKRNLEVGLGFILLGMMGAVPLLWQRKTEKKSPAPDATEKKEGA